MPQKKKSDLIAEAEAMGHVVPADAKMNEIRALLKIRPQVIESKTVVIKKEDAHWCMNCRFYRKAPQDRPFMVCGKRGGKRDPNDGESCPLFERK